MIATIAFTAMGSPAPTLPDAWIVAIGITRRAPVGERKGSSESHRADAQDGRYERLPAARGRSSRAMT
jgi:hypothetical protein